MGAVKQFAGSIAGRLSLASLLFLPLLLLATGVGLDRAFRQSLLQAEEQQLTTWIYLLLAAADTEGGELQMPAAFTEPRLTQPGSNLYAFVHKESDGRIEPEQLLWQSPSARWLGSDTLGLQHAQQLVPKISQFGRLDDQHFVLRYRVQWEQEEGPDLNLVFSLYHGSDEFNQQLAAFSESLWRWLAAIAVMLMTGQWLLLYWALKPLRGVSAQISALGRGEVALVEGRYASELQPLIDSLNLLLAQEKTGRDRYRNALSDLAHSVKTPLAVLRNEMHEQEKNEPLILEQIQRLEDIVSRQLSRASLAHGAIKSRQDVVPVARRLAASLNKLFPAVSIQVVPDKLALAVDEKDLFDLLGNLLENACKYGATRIRLEGGEQVYRGQRCTLLSLADDGPGMSEAARARVLHRGARADESRAGQGLGLSLVQDIVLAHGGELLMDASDMGGLQVTCRFPQ